MLLFLHVKLCIIEMKQKKELTFSIISGNILEFFCILCSVHTIAHLPFIGRRSNEGACVEQAPFALYILFSFNS